MTHQEKVRLTWFVNIAVVCLGFGIVLPVMRIDANDGTIKGFIMAFITPGPSSYSILSSIWALIRNATVMDILLGRFSKFQVRSLLSHSQWRHFEQRYHTIRPQMGSVFNA